MFNGITRFGEGARIAEDLLGSMDRVNGVVVHLSFSSYRSGLYTFVNLLDVVVKAANIWMLY
jgi:hypothetical protein